MQLLGDNNRVLKVSTEKEKKHNLSGYRIMFYWNITEDFLGYNFSEDCFKHEIGYIAVSRKKEKAKKHPGSKNIKCQ